MSMTPALSIQDLKKTYKGGHVALKGVSFDVARGDFFALLGPNGAGKTTSFYMIVGLIAADAGLIVLDGEDITLRPMHARARLGDVLPGRHHAADQPQRQRLPVVHVDVALA